jgi:hypothetical protein
LFECFENETAALLFPDSIATQLYIQGRKVYAGVILGEGPVDILMQFLQERYSPDTVESDCKKL